MDDEGELDEDQFEFLLRAFKSVRDTLDGTQAGWQAAIDELNSKQVLDSNGDPILLVVKEVGRLVTEDDVRQMIRRRQIRKLFSDIQDACRTAVRNENSLAQLKTFIISLCQ